MEKVEQVVRLIRSKGVSVWFITQNPSDIPDSVLGQIGNRVQHALRAYTPNDQKALRAAAKSFRVNPAFNTEEALQALGVGEALVSVLDEKGVPSIVQKAGILPPRSSMSAAPEADVQQAIQKSPLYQKYTQSMDRRSAYEVLEEVRDQQAAQEEAAARQAAWEKEQKAREKEMKAQQAAWEREQREREQHRWPGAGQADRPGPVRHLPPLTAHRISYKSSPGKAALFQGMIAFFRNESWRFHIRRRPDSIHLHAVAPDKIGRLRRSGDGPGEDIQQV